MNSRKMFVHAKINCVSKMHIQQTMLRGNNGTISEHFFSKVWDQILSLTYLKVEEPQNSFIILGKHFQF